MSHQLRGLAGKARDIISWTFSSPPPIWPPLLP